VKKECECCGKLTDNKKFCSRSCSAKINNKNTPKRTVSRKCKKCDNKAKSYRHTLCKEHFDEWRLRFKQESTLGEYQNMLSVKGKHKSWASSHIRAFARSWLKHLINKPCANCGYSKHVELAHIRPVSSFADTDKLSEVNSEKNVIQLCRNCHWEFDNESRKGLFTNLLNSLNKLRYTE
jgi:hypothetical protein